MPSTALLLYSASFLGSAWLSASGWCPTRTSRPPKCSSASLEAASIRWCKKLLFFLKYAKSLIQGSLQDLRPRKQYMRTILNLFVVYNYCICIMYCRWVSLSCRNKYLVFFISLSVFVMSLTAKREVGNIDHLDDLLKPHNQHLG